MAPAARELNVGVKTSPPFAMKSTDGAWYGASIDFWEHAARSQGLGFRYVEAASVGDLISGLKDGQFDAAISAITVSVDRARDVDFSFPHVTTAVGVAAPDNGSGLWAAIRSTFLSFGFVQTLAALIGLTIIVGAIVWWIERRTTARFKGGANGLGQGIWWSAIAMTKAAAAQDAPETLRGRIVAVAWMIGSIVIVSMLTVGLSSSLTKRELLGAVQSEDDLRSARVGIVSGYAWKEVIAAQRIRAREFPTVEDGLRALQNEKLDAFIYDKPALQWSVSQGFSNTVRVLDGSLGEQYYSIAFPKSSELRQRLEMPILEASESDWWTQTISSYTESK